MCDIFFNFAPAKTVGNRKSNEENSKKLSNNGRKEKERECSRNGGDAQQT